ncbi:hypothetical protein ABZ297_14100 [Nonomuraea sp. NPDC005983]|uniref:hypothetical protein n=1 Tax=Nonomuraea sp. NPDC005983 TaxID=3155595 RepID=UPI0033BCA44E
MRLPADAQSLSGTGPGDLWAVGARHEGPAAPRTGAVWAVGHLEADGGFWRRAAIAQYG